MDSITAPHEAVNTPDVAPPEPLGNLLSIAKAPQHGDWTEPSSRPPVIPGERFESTLRRLTGWFCGDKLKVRGSYVDLLTFEKMVGRTAAMVYAALSLHRNPDMECWPSRAAIARDVERYFFVSLSLPQVKRALAKLTRLRLERIAKRHVHRGPHNSFGELVVRQVQGRVFKHPKACMWLVAVGPGAKRALTKKTKRGNKIGQNGWTAMPPGPGEPGWVRPKPRRRKTPVPPVSVNPLPPRTAGECEPPTTELYQAPTGVMLSASQKALGNSPSLKAKQPAVPSPASPSASTSSPEADSDSKTIATTPAEPAVPVVPNPPAATISAEEAAFSALVQAAQGKRSIGSVPVTPTDGEIDWRIRGLLQLRPGSTFAELASLTGLDYAVVYDELGRALKGYLVRLARVGNEKRWWIV